MPKRVIRAKAPKNTTIDNIQELGEHIKFARTSLGISVVDAAALCNVSSRTYIKIEKGKETVSIGSTFNALRAFGLQLDITMEHIDEY